jgi:Leucine-rich repeat (LRR) protein
LEELPTSIGQLRTLQKLDLSRCFELKDLLTSTNELIELQKIDFLECSKLKELPNFIGKMTTH